MPKKIVRKWSYSQLFDFVNKSATADSVTFWEKFLKQKLKHIKNDDEWGKELPWNSTHTWTRAVSIFGLKTVIFWDSAVSQLLSKIRSQQIHFWRPYTYRKRSKSNFWSFLKNLSVLLFYIFPGPSVDWNRKIDQSWMKLINQSILELTKIVYF